MSEIPLRKISYYDEFECQCSRCIDNCCHGWVIPLDEDILDRIKKEKGAYGIWLRSTVHGKNQKIFSPLSIRCPHLTRDGYCGIQKRKGEGYIADVCREYPRIRFNFGPAAEYFLDLSCVHAASLFLNHVDDEDVFVRGRAEVLPDTYGNNEEYEHFELLEQHRMRMVAEIRRAARVSAEELNDSLRAYAGREWRVQNELLIKGGSRLWECDEAEDIGCDLFPLPTKHINEMMSTCFYEEWLKYSSPFLYKLCRMYYKNFDRLDYAQGDEELKRLFDTYIATDKTIVKVMGDYMVSVLLRRYMMSFEDYSPYHHFKDAYLMLNLFCLFYVLWYDKNGKPKKKDVARIIAAAEKRFFHNDNALKDVHAAVKAEKQNGKNNP